MRMRDPRAASVSVLSFQRFALDQSCGVQGRPKLWCHLSAASPMDSTTCSIGWPSDRPPSARSFTILWKSIPASRFIASSSRFIAVCLVATVSHPLCEHFTSLQRQMSPRSCPRWRRGPYTPIEIPPPAVTSPVVLATMGLLPRRGCVLRKPTVHRGALSCADVRVAASSRPSSHSSAFANLCKESMRIHEPTTTMMFRRWFKRIASIRYWVDCTHCGRMGSGWPLNCRDAPASPFSTPCGWTRIPEARRGNGPAASVPHVRHTLIGSSALVDGRPRYTRSGQGDRLGVF